jgi:hypothetical protein
MNAIIAQNQTSHSFVGWAANELKTIRSVLRNRLDATVASSLFGVPACAILAIGITYVLYVLQDYSGNGEPFSWFNGTSAWPSIGIIIFAGLLSIQFTLKAHLELESNAAKLTGKFCLQGTKEDCKETPLFCWEFPRSEPGPIANKNTVEVGVLWRQYVRLGRLRSRFFRSAPMVLLYIVVLVIIQPLLGSMPTAPVRGAFPFHFVIGFTVIAFLFLTFVVIDAIFLHEGFLKHLAGLNSEWPPETGQKFGYTGRALEQHGKNLADYWDILLIARRTQAVGSQIYYPFIILSLLIVARLNYFDNWSWSHALVVVLSLHFLLAFYAAWRLPKIATEYRDRVLQRMKRRQRQALMVKQRTPEAIDTMIAEVQSTHQGAFAYLWEQPAIRALLLPSGGIGLITLFQYLPH